MRGMPLVPTYGRADAGAAMAHTGPVSEGGGVLRIHFTPTTCRTSESLRSPTHCGNWSAVCADYRPDRDGSSSAIGVARPTTGSARIRW